MSAETLSPQPSLDPNQYLPSDNAVLEESYAKNTAEFNGQQFDQHLEGPYLDQFKKIALENSLADYFSVNGASYATLVDKLNKGEEQETPLTPAYEFRHAPIEDLVNVLVETGVMSQELVDSGVLARFAPDRVVMSERQPHLVGGLRHILLGDIKGGLHDVDTLEDAGVVGDTRFIEGGTEKGNQKRTENNLPIEMYPDFRVGFGIDKDKDGVFDEVKFKEFILKSQFPEEWSTDRVILEIVSAADSPGLPQVEGSTNARHRKVIQEMVNSVLEEIEVMAFTNINTGLIEAAFVNRRALSIEPAMA